MALTIKHAFVSGKADGSDTSLIRPSNWNADHQITGTIAETELSLTDVTTNNATTGRHGLLPKLSNNAAQFLNGTGAYSVPTVAEAQIILTDVTTGNVTTSAHGFVPKATGVATVFLNGNAAYSTVPEGGLSLSDVTTGNATDVRHGFLPKLSNVATEFLNGTGAFSVPVSISLSADNTWTGNNEFAYSGIDNTHPFTVKVSHNAGTVTTTQGFNVLSTLTGTITNARGAYIQTSVGASGAVTSSVGMYITTPVVAGGGAVTNRYGLYVDAQAASGITNKWNIFSAGVGSLNRFEGTVDVGGTVLSTVFQSIVNGVTFSATPVFDAAAGNIQSIILTGNVTSSTFTNAADGQIVTFMIIQDGSGSHTFAWPANLFGAITIGAGANARTAQSFYCNGGNGYAIDPGHTY